MVCSVDRTVFALFGLALAGAVRLRPVGLPAWLKVHSRGARSPELTSAAKERAHSARYLEVLAAAPRIDLEYDEEREMRIYNSHWGALRPPPYHHPKRWPTEDEFKELERLEENYTRYWRSLPKFPRLSNLTEDMEGWPYISVSNWSIAWQARPQPSIGNYLMFMCHHKTGVTARQSLVDALQGHFNILEGFDDLNVGVDDWPVGLKTIHFVRDPVDTIVSAYRYHMNRWGQETWSWGQGKYQDPPCFMCGDDDHKAIFDTCGFNCTYFELLNRLDETSGVKVEALSSRLSVTSQALFLGFQASNPNTLRLSFDLLNAGYEQTIACILRFLGLEANEGLRHRLEATVKEVRDPHHVTEGQYHNAKLKAMLRRHPTWGPDFRDIADLMSDLYRRQAAIYGCPDISNATRAPYEQL